MDRSALTGPARFVGSGDSFGGAGRFQTCIMVDSPQSRFCMDFGTSSLIALECASDGLVGQLLRSPCILAEQSAAFASASDHLTHRHGEKDASFRPAH
jgi:hypothetical protein